VIGQRISHFYVIGRLGSGGMGDVYEAQDMRLPRTVALKVIKPSLVRSPTAVKRFAREARLSASLNHPNICTIIDVGEGRGVSFIAMELLQGSSLKQRLRSGPLALGELLGIAADVVRALVAAHAAGIVHRDITPGNIFITHSGAAKLLDFGLAKVLELDDSDDHVTDGVTEVGTVAGTVHHLAPEQLRQGGVVDRRSDLFALGTVLYYAAAGVRPFEAPTKREVIEQVVAQEPIPLRRIAPRYPAEFERIVTKLLQKDPARRYQRGSDVLRDLELVRDLDPTATRASGTKLGTVLSAAVLSFTLLGDVDHELRSFRDGLAEDIAWWLQRGTSIRVASRTSTESLRGQPVRALGTQLGVNAVLEGSVQRTRGMLRITCNAIDTVTEAPLGSGVRMDIAADDLLAAQDTVARQVVDFMRSLAARVRGRAATKNAEAQSAYKLGLDAMRELFNGKWQRVIDLAKRTSDADQEFAQAYVLEADAYNAAGLLSFMVPRFAFREAARAANEALARDEHLPSAHAALALARFGGSWDWEGADKAYRRALELDPDLAIARVHYSWLLGLLGHEEAALTEANRAANGSRSRMVRTSAALTYFMAARYDMAIEACAACLDADPNFVFATYLRGQCYHMKQMYVEAHADLERAAQIANRMPFYLGLLGKSYGESGRHDKAIEIVRELDAMPRDRLYVAPHCYVYIFHGLGERERALRYQEQAYDDGASPLNYLTPFIRSLFSLDPDLRDRLRQMRLNV
jgi:serine/threonine protein kinase/Tfp pilus assembly protein PilF